MTATVTKTAVLNRTAIDEIGCTIKKSYVLPALKDFEALGKTKMIKEVRTKTVAE